MSSKEVKRVILLLPDTLSVWSSTRERRRVMNSMITDPLLCLKRSSRPRMRTKTAVDLLTLSAIGWGWGWGKYTDDSFFVFFALSPCSYALCTLSRPRFACLLADIRIEKENNVCVQARLRRSDPRSSETQISKLTNS